MNILELKIDQLLQQYIQLLDKNKHLRQQVMQLQQDYALLLKKNELATTQIKHVVSQLREELHDRIL